MDRSNRYSNPLEAGLKTLPKKLLRNIEDYGFWIALKKSISFFLKPIYQKKVFILYELNIKNPSDQKGPDADFRFRMLTPEDVKYIRQIEEMEEWLEGELGKRLETNGICMAALANDQVAGFNLATRGEGIIPLLKLKVITPADEAWSEQITIHKDYRRRGLGSLLRSRFYAELRRRGVKALYGHRQLWNVASKRSASKYTLREMVMAEYIKFFSVERFRYTRLATPQIYSSLLSDTENGTINTKKKHQYFTPSKKTDFAFTIHLKAFGL